MNEPRRGTNDRREYLMSRAARRRQLRRRRLAALAVFIVAVAALAYGVKALFSGGDAAGSSGRRTTSTAAANGATADSTTTAAVATDRTAGEAATPASSRTPGQGATSARAATPAPAPSPSMSPAAVIEIGWVGDTTPGSRYGLPPSSGRALFGAVRKQLQAPDLMIANLEGTYSSGGPSKCDGVDSNLCFAFQAPPSYARALPWAGIDLVSVANNHSYDYFARGLSQTTAALKGAGVKYAGLPGTITSTDVQGVRVAVVAFSPYSWNANVNDIAGAGQLVRRAAAKADVVVVLTHVGAEGADKTHTPRGAEVAFGEQRGNPRAFSHAVVDAGADLVLGSGPHVIRGVERYRNRLIAYSLGNFGGWGNFGLGGNLSLSGLLTVKLDAQGRVQGGRWLSLLLTSPGVPKVDSAHSAARLVRRLSAEDFARTYPLDAKGYFGGT
jgi:hypothetical protein